MPCPIYASSPWGDEMIRFNKAGTVGVLTFDGDLTRRRVTEMKTALMSAIANVDHLIINLRKVRNIDVSCFNLLRIAERNTQILHKRLTLVIKANKTFRRLLELEPVWFSDLLVRD